MWARLRSFVRSLVRRDQFETGMTEELRFHLEAVKAELVRRGVPPEEAERRAHVGGVERAKDDCRQVRGVLLIDQLRSEVRYAARRCVKAPGFTAATVLTLAVAIGANAAIFAVVHRVILNPLPYPQSDRLLHLEHSLDRINVASGSGVTARP